MASTVPAQAQTAAAPAAAEATSPGGPVRLRQPLQVAPSGPAQPAAPMRRDGEDPLPKPRSEFETFVMDLVKAGGKSELGPLRRFGADLLEGHLSSPAAAEGGALVPPDYVIQPGDELIVTLWGSVDADLRLVVDRSGRISVPRVGPILVSGVRYADVADTISRRVGLVFKNFQLSATLGQLRGIRVYLTGFVQKPGTLVVNGLSTLSQALMQAGGPSPAGSFRQVELRRGAAVVSRFDLYDLLLRGDRSADRLLQADDVVHVGPVGAQVAVIGSVNQPAIFEMKADETVADALKMAGGFSAVADTTRLAIERMGERTTLRVRQIDLPAGGTQTLNSGDILRAFNAISLLASKERQNKRVRIEGEVMRPGEYVLPPNSTLRDALQAAGGATANAFLFGAEFSRESVRATQQVNFERALRDLETDLARQATSRRGNAAEDLANQTAAAQASARLLERLRSVRPTGRVVLQMPPSGGDLPDLTLEDGDRLLLPSASSAVGVFGSVFNSGSFLYSENRGIEDYLRLAGGPTRGADDGGIFVVRANGNVVSQLQEKGWFKRGDALLAMRALPGDTIFVPEDTDKFAFMQITKDWTQIFFQLGVGLAGMKTAIGF